MKNPFPFSAKILWALAAAFIALMVIYTYRLVHASSVAAFAGLVISCAGLLAVLIVSARNDVMAALKPLLEERTGHIKTAGAMLSPSLTHRQQLELAAVNAMAGHAVGCSSGERSGKQVRAALDALTGSGTSARDSRDVASDPAGVLIVKAGEPLKAATSQTAARVTPADIEANIVECHYINAGAAVDANWPDENARDERHPSLGQLTICVLVLRNGTKLVGVNYGAIDPARHDAEQGRVEARAAAVEQVWPLLGYELRTKLATA